MKPSIDNFSSQAKMYQKYRPIYPKALYEKILSPVPQANDAWDCGTGNGQVAVVLADYFKRVEATDISAKQIHHAPKKENIHYQVLRAEQTNFAAASFDLITVAQAIHWFDFEAFYQEVNRVGKKGGILAVFGYGLLRIESAVDECLDHFYKNIIGPYWNVERRHIDNAYESVPFPFEIIPVEESFCIETSWNLPQLEGYLNTWSSVQRFIKKENYNPVDEFVADLKKVWENGTVKKVKFPILLKIGRI